MNKNENTLSQDILEIKDNIQKTLQNMEIMKKTFNIENEESFYEDINIKNKSKSKNHKLHITFFIPVLQFLDIKSLIELSKVNHLFYSFIYSFYFYRSVNQILIYSNNNLSIQKDDNYSKRRVKTIKTNQLDKTLDKSSQSDDSLIFGPTKKIYSSFMSALTGALSYISPLPEMTNRPKEKNELEEIEKKINLHEKLLDERIKQLAISNEIKATRDEINKYIKEQYNIKKNHKKNELNKNNHNKINTQTIKQLKREKYESEYKALIQEINEYETKYNELKKENETQSKEGIDLETKINKIKHYGKNVFTSDEKI